MPSQSEAAALLKILAKSSQATHEVAALSLLSKMRASERLKLTWSDISFEDGTIFVKDAKNTRNRRAYITAEMFDVLIRRHQL